MNEWKDQKRHEQIEMLMNRTTDTWSYKGHIRGGRRSENLGILSGGAGGAEGAVNPPQPGGQIMPTTVLRAPPDF